MSDSEVGSTPRRIDNPLSESLACAVSTPPGPAALDAVLRALAAPRTLSLDAQVDLLIVIDRLRSLLDAAHQQALAELDADDDSTKQWSREQAGAALRVSSRAIPRRVARARTLVNELPATLAALREGVINPEQAKVIAEGAWSVPPTATRQYEAAVLGGAHEQTLVETQRIVEQSRIAADPDNAQHRYHRAVEHRAVAMAADVDGMATLTLYARTVDVQSVFTRLTSASRALPVANTRTLDQRRADLLVDLVLQGLDADTLPKAQGRGPNVMIHVNAATLAGDDDQPAWVDGCGAIPAAAARQAAIADDAIWQRIVSDPMSGEVLDIGRRKYRPSKAMVDFIATRDQECVAPGCRTPAALCDAEHIEPFSADPQTAGTTTQNLAMTCRRHHNGKTHGPFRYDRNPDGSYTWSLGTRHRFTTRALRRLPPRPPETPPMAADPPPF